MTNLRDAPMQGNGGYTELSMLCVVACGWCVTWIGTLHLDQVPAPHSKPCMLLVLVMYVWKFHPPPNPNPNPNFTKEEFPLRTETAVSEKTSP